MKNKIVITGGQLVNKGAQAMTFITTDEVAKRFPGRETVLLSNMDYRRPKEEKEQYCFRIQNYPAPGKLFMLSFVPTAMLMRLFGGQTVKAYEKLMSETEAIVDVSGYSLGSNWGVKKSVFFVTRIAIAKRYGIPVYLMPQSFGPFDYKGITAGIVNRMIKKNLKYASVIMCREQEGYDLLKEKYGLENLVKMPDLVLQNQGIEEGNVYKEVPVSTLPEVPAGSVAVIPNLKTFRYGNPERLYEMYQVAIQTLLDRGKQVYLIYHSGEDLKVCQKVKEDYFGQHEKVILMEKELSCLEFDHLVQKFDFVVASRFHAVVHAYRNAIPAVVPGWAVKYRELLDLFGQTDNLFDVRKEIEMDKVAKVIGDMCDSYPENSRQIAAGLKEIRRNNVYDYVLK